MDTTKYIEDYFNHRLTEDERSMFEEKMQGDETFAKEVKEHALLINAFDELKAEELSQRFNSLEAAMNVGKGQQVGYTVYLKWAATIAVLAMLSFLVYRSNNTSQQELFLAYYSPYPNVENPVSRSATDRQDAWMFYEQGNYAEAAKLFKRRVMENNTDLAGWFYLGLCELAQNRTKEAENAFAKVLAQKGSKYFEQAQWYTTLSDLRSGKYKKVAKGLEEIISTQSSYSERAKLLLEELP